MNDYQCLTCGHEVLANEMPQPIRWSDGHVCHFVQQNLGKKAEEPKSKQFTITYLEACIILKEIDNMWKRKTGQMDKNLIMRFHKELEEFVLSVKKDINDN
jgi:hypothetical protein